MLLEIRTQEQDNPKQNKSTGRRLEHFGERLTIFTQISRILNLLTIFGIRTTQRLLDAWTVLSLILAAIRKCIAKAHTYRVQRPVPDHPPPSFRVRFRWSGGGARNPRQ